MKKEWSSEVRARHRRPWLLLIKDGKVTRFHGESIPGLVAVVGSDWIKCGRWSYTDYRLEIADDVRAIAGGEGWHNGTFREGLAGAVGSKQPLDRWSDVANALGVSLTECRRFLSEEFPREVEELDRIEADLEAVDSASPTGAEEITITFGSPLKRTMEAGFWNWPVRVLDADGNEVGRVEPGPFGHGWYEPTVTGNIRLLDSTHEGGHHGGYWSLRLAAPAGCRAVHDREVSNG